MRVSHTARMGYELRACSKKEFAAFMRTLQGAFGSEPTENDIARMGRVLEPDRTLGVFDDGAMVATAGAFSFVLTVPGGELPAAGVTVVGVLPSHRRRGIMTSLMQRQLEDIKERGEPLAILWASEGAIYRRFGYGLASQHASIDVERGRARFLASGSAPARTTLVSHDEALDVLPPIYEAVRVQTPGMFARDRTWWDAHRLYDPEEGRNGGGPMFRVVVAGEGDPDAYALYRVHQAWGTDGLPHGKLEVIEALATTARATRALWEYLLGVDLVERVTAFSVPVDFPLKFMLEEMRRLRMRVMDALWLRVVDVPAALQGRSYAAEGRVTFELVDRFSPSNSGTWELEVTRAGARVDAVREASGIRLAAEDLGAVYLGGTSFAELHRAGRVEELTPGALSVADDLFYTDRAPWCPEIF